MAMSYPATLSLSPISGPVHATVALPGSKSITNRALLLASLAGGESVLRGPLHSDDTRVMADCLRMLGVFIHTAGNGDLHVSGRKGQFAAPPGALHVGNSGTTVRFLCAAACLTPPNVPVTLDGVERMRERPIADLLDALRQLGVDAQSVNASGCPPVRIVGAGGLRGGEATVSGKVSSQFLSALLMVAPLAASDVTIHVVGDLVSKPYVDLTQTVMAAFGAQMENDGYRTLHVAGGQRYHAVDYAIEADASAASYFLAAAAVTGGTVTLSNLESDSAQGDVQFADVLEQMGCTVSRGAQLSVTGPAHLKAIDVNMEAIPDTAQTLAVLCAFADGPSRITGLQSLRVKETDRVDAIAAELRKMGVGVEAGPDFWAITPPPKGNLHGATVETYNDHRMAMSFAVASLRVPGVIIDNPGCVAKTFPQFWDTWQNAFPPQNKSL